MAIFEGPSAPAPSIAGTDELRTFYLDCFSTGGISLELCALTDDGQQCAVEYNCLRWGEADLPPQAGLAVFERELMSCWRRSGSTTTWSDLRPRPVRCPAERSRPTEGRFGQPSTFPGASV